MKRHYLVAFVVVLTSLLAVGSTVHAQSSTSSDGDWSSGSVWSPGSEPTGAESAQIQNNIFVTKQVRPLPVLPSVR